MKHSFFILFFLCFCNLLFSQIDFNEHKQSILDRYSAAEDLEGVFNANLRAVQYAEDYLRFNSIDENYITNRQLLHRIHKVKCKDSSFVRFSETLENLTKIEVEIGFKIFDSLTHDIEEIYDVIHVDGERAFGSYYGVPHIQIDFIEIRIEGKKIRIPKEAYSNLYEIYCCTPTYMSKDAVEMYTSKDGEYLFLYFFGGFNANTYMAKLVFNSDEYLTSIIADYVTLRRWSAFSSKDFLGF